MEQHYQNALPLLEMYDMVLPPVIEHSRPLGHEKGFNLWEWELRLKEGERIGYLRVSWVPSEFLSQPVYKWGAQWCQLEEVTDYETYRQLSPATKTRYQHTARYIGNNYIDKPFVAYSHIKMGWRKMGLARLLYLHAAKQLGEKGLPLYSSGTKSCLAKRFWKKMPSNCTHPAWGTKGISFL